MIIVPFHHLNDTRGNPAYRAKVTDGSDVSVTMEVEQYDPMADNGWSQVAIIFLKWDGCAHVGFRDPELGNNWVHVCGRGDMLQVIAMLDWAWKLAASLIPKYDRDVARDPL